MELALGNRQLRQEVAAMMGEGQPSPAAARIQCLDRFWPPGRARPLLSSSGNGSQVQPCSFPALLHALPHQGTSLMCSCPQ